MEQGLQAAPDASAALAQVIGALAYAQLRVFQLSAAGTASAPTFALAEAQADFAVEELERYRSLRRRIDRLTPDTEAALNRFRAPLDAFFDEAPSGDWLGLQVFQFLGDAIAADFAGLLAARIDADSASSVREALGSRAAHDAFALEHVRAALAEDPSARDRAVKVAGEIVGRALNALREAMLASDALAVVLGGQEQVKALVMELLANHRERLDRLGLEAVD
jgi:1,2-phenylacetyl-CoA epoxidase catalytic subunit